MPLIRVAPVERRERDHAKWLDCPVFSGGLESHDLLALLRTRRRLGAVVAESSNSGRIIGTDQLWTPVETLDSQLHPAHLEEIGFVRTFLPRRGAAGCHRGLCTCGGAGHPHPVTTEYHSATGPGGQVLEDEVKGASAPAVGKATLAECASEPEKQKPRWEQWR